MTGLILAAEDSWFLLNAAFTEIRWNRQKKKKTSPFPFAQQCSSLDTLEGDSDILKMNRFQSEIMPVKEIAILVFRLMDSPSQHIKQIISTP
ncbi:uncharacterized [Tachysurus ichikawai]